LLVLQAWRQ